MYQKQLNQLVADATGEDLHEIRHRGFSLVDPFESNFDPEPDELSPNFVDWDELALQRNVAVVDQRQRSFSWNA
jgi:hypothetical protein